MPITKLGDVLGDCHPLGSGGPNPYALNVPAGGIPADVTLIVMGWNGKRPSPRGVVSVTDSRSNVYTVRASSSADDNSCFLIDSQITTALLAGDKININMNGTDALLSVVAAWFTKCYFDKLALANYTTTAATGGTITPAGANELILGVFGGFAYSSSQHTIVTPGAGYTNQAGFGKASNIPDFRRANDPEINPLSWSSIAMDWESKIGLGGAETATATMAVASSAGGMTAAYFEMIPIQMMGVV